MQPQVKVKDELQTMADSFMNGLSEDPGHVQSYFNHPTLDEYADIKD